MRKIKFDDGVFNRIIGSDREISSYDRFSNVQKGILGDRKVETALDYYNRTVQANRNTFERLAHVEDLIILYRIRANRNIDLFIQQQKDRNYIYARIACPRETQNRDIRACVGRADIFPEGHDCLQDPEVIAKADEIICEYLDQLIKEKEYIVNSLVQDLNLETV
jgi:hypothetical protein